MIHPSLLFVLNLPAILTVLPDECIGVLNSVYSILHPDIQMLSELPTAVKKFSSVEVNGYKLSSMSEKKASHVPYVLASPVFPFPSTSSEVQTVRPAQIQYFIKHSFTLSGHPEDCISHVFAVVLWPQVHPKQHCMGKPVEVWCKSVFEHCIENRYVPIENILSHVFISFEHLENEEVVVVIPLVQ